MALILLGGIAIQLAAVSAPPQNSNDLYRYIWDGRVQAAGIDPYAVRPRRPPARPGCGTSSSGIRGAEYCVTQAVVRAHPAADLAAGCTRINRPKVPTIYPPVAEAYFLGVHYLPDASDSTTPIQATTAGVAVLITGLLLFGLRRLGRDMRMAALWSWCPTVALEAGNSAHVDVVAVGIAAAALLVLATARTTRRTVLGGVLLGLAIATKLIPALTVPAVLRRRWVTVCLAAGSAFVAVYIPHVIAVGSKVIGFLPGYLQQEGYTSGTRFGIIGLFLTGRAAIAAAVLVLAVVALAVLRFSDPDQPWRGAVVMTAAALAVATPHYQWYALLLVMLVALDGRAGMAGLCRGRVLRRRTGPGPPDAPVPVPRRDRVRRARADRGGRLAGPPRRRRGGSGSSRRRYRLRGGAAVAAVPAAAAVPLLGRGGELGVCGAAHRPGCVPVAGLRARPTDCCPRDRALSYRLVTREPNIKRQRPPGP